MINKTPIVDYEPVTRSGAARSQGEELPDQGLGSGFANAESAFAMSGPVGALPAAKPNREERKTATSRRTHSLTFVGLFMFTAVLYFRPYEFHPALKFLSNSAFWLAIFTLILYVPTQLGLNKKLAERQPEVTLVILVAVAGLVSIPLALDPFYSWLSLVDYMKVVVMFIVMVNVVRTEKRLNALILLAMAVSCVSSGAAVNDYRMGRLLTNGTRIEGVIGGLFSNPNDLALHLVTMVPIAVALFLASKTIPRKLLYLCCSCLFVAGVVATYSRGGFIGLACATVVLAWKLARRNRVFFAAAGFVLVLLVVAVGPGGYKDRLTGGADSSAEARSGELKRSVFLMLRHPLVGLGMNNYILFSNTSHASHNSYTQVGSELGVPAMLAYILFLVTPLRRLAAIRKLPASPGSRGRYYYLVIGIEASLISYMVASFFLSVAYMWYAYYLVGYAIALRRLSEDELQSLELEKPPAQPGSMTLQQGK
jgi:putative inorganic carbon (hco3(-)) transporter